MPNLYKKLIRACSQEQFTTSCELKPNYKPAVEVGTTVKSNKKIMHALEDYLEVCDSFVIMKTENNWISFNWHYVTYSSWNDRIYST